MPERVFRTELTPVDLLARAAYMYPEKVAVVHGDRRYTYAEFGERAWRLANALRDAGLEKGDRVATLLPNSPAMLEAHFGVPAAGGILVTVNTRLSRRRRSRTSSSTRAPASCCSTPSSPSSSSRSTSPAST